MEQREEKTKHTHIKRSRRQSSSTLKPATSSFPLDLISEILLRLPAKFVVRFRFVSKLWSSITSNLYFTNLYETHQSPNLLMFFKKGSNLFVSLFPLHNYNSNDQLHSYSQHVDSYRMKYPKRCCFPFTESVHGLICFRIASKPIIWNPTMRQFKTLRKPEKSWKGIAIFLGYDPMEGKHKLVCMPRDNTCDECWILTLGSTKESWRKIKTNHNHQPIFRYYGQCINGVLYYQAYIDHMGINNPAIMSFDVKSEKFDMIELPCSSFAKMLIPYRGKLACVSNIMNKGVVDGITLWTLEDAEKHKWSCKQFLAPFAYRSLETNFKLAGITHTGEFIYVPSTFLNSFYILYFDPKINNFRKVEFRGVADKVFRLGNELGDKRLNRLHTFPHHIQSLMSL